LATGAARAFKAVVEASEAEQTMNPKAGCLIAITALMAQTQASAQVYFRDGHRVVEDCRSSDAILRNIVAGTYWACWMPWRASVPNLINPVVLNRRQPLAKPVTQFVAALEANPASIARMPAIVGLSLAYQARCKARS